MLVRIHRPVRTGARKAPVPPPSAVEAPEAMELFDAEDSSDNELLHRYVDTLLAVYRPNRKMSGAGAKHFVKRVHEYLLDAKDDASRNFNK